MAFKVKKPHNSLKNDLLHTEIRKKLGITQVQLAAMLKVSRAYVSFSRRLLLSPAALLISS